MNIFSKIFRIRFFSLLFKKCDEDIHHENIDFWMSLYFHANKQCSVSNPLFF